MARLGHRLSGGRRFGRRFLCPSKRKTGRHFLRPNNDEDVADDELDDGDVDDDKLDDDDVVYFVSTTHHKTKSLCSLGQIIYELPGIRIGSV